MGRRCRKSPGRFGEIVASAQEGFNWLCWKGRSPEIAGFPGGFGQSVVCHPRVGQVFELLRFCMWRRERARLPAPKLRGKPLSQRETYLEFRGCGTAVHNSFGHARKGWAHSPANRAGRSLRPHGSGRPQRTPEHPDTSPCSLPPEDDASIRQMTLKMNLWKPEHAICFK